MAFLKIISQSRHQIVISCMLFIWMSCTPKQKIVLSGQGENIFSGPFENILIHEATGGIGPCEPSICIDPKNTKKLVAASVLNHVYTSDNAGKTWKKSTLSSSHGVYGDPVVRYDFKGNVYYSHLANSKGQAYNSVEFLDRIVVQKSMDDGLTWTDGSFPKVDHVKDHDKQWKAVDPKTGHIAMTWTEFDKYGSKDSGDKSRILFSITKDEGKTWSDAVVISDFEGDCLDDDKTTEGAHPAFGTEGEIYVVWAFDEKIWLDISYDGGQSWGKDSVIAQQPGGWSYAVSGVGRCNGFPTIKTNHSEGAGRGNLYVQWSDQRAGTSDTDVFLIRSGDKGKNWTNPLRVNNDQAGKQQFFSWMDVDIADGSLYLVFYDRRNHENDATDVYLAYSKDQGDTFGNVKISETPFTPKKSLFFGDYNDISAVNGIIRPIWTRQEGQKLGVYTAIINLKK